MEMKRAIVVAESHSREGKETFERASDALRSRGITVEGSHLEAGHDAVRKRLKQSVKAGAELIVLIGGDGTQTIAADVLAHTKSVLGVVPAGTGNSFALSLGIGSVEQAFDAIAGGRTKRIDVGIVNGRRFANFATIGAAAVIADDTHRWLKRLTGPLAYGIEAVGPLLKMRPFGVRVKWKKNRLKLKTQQLLVVNGRMYGHTPVTPDSTLDDGLLTFFAVPTRTPLDVVKTYISFLNDTQTELPQAHFFRTKRLRIRTSRKARISIDGNAMGTTPARFGVDRRALRVRVPA